MKVMIKIEAVVSCHYRWNVSLRPFRELTAHRRSHCPTRLWSSQFSLFPSSTVEEKDKKSKSIFFFKAILRYCLCYSSDNTTLNFILNVIFIRSVCVFF